MFLFSNSFTPGKQRYYYYEASRLHMHRWMNKHSHISILQRAADVIISTLNLWLVNLFDALQSLLLAQTCESFKNSQENMCLKEEDFLFIYFF